MKQIFKGTKLIAVLVPFFFLSTEAVATSLLEKLVQSDGSIECALFAPRQSKEIEEILLGLIAQERKKITGALFRFSNKNLGLALLEAHFRGVQIELVVDGGAITDTGSSQILTLAKAGVPLLLYDPTLAKEDKDRFAPIMHHKFLVFHKTLNGQRVSVTGSLNWTQSAFSGNCENIVVSNKRGIVNQFINEFDWLKNVSNTFMYTHNKPKPKTEFKKNYRPVPYKNPPQRRYPLPKRILQELQSGKLQRYVRFVK